LQQRVDRRRHKACPGEPVSDSRIQITLTLSLPTGAGRRPSY
jgi:hypothetical protein